MKTPKPTYSEYPTMAGLETERLGESHSELVRTARRVIRDLAEIAPERADVDPDGWRPGSAPIRTEMLLLRSVLERYSKARQELLKVLPESIDFVDHLDSKNL